jgi:hypothetical protein
MAMRISDVILWSTFVAYFLTLAVSVVIGP